MLKSDQQVLFPRPRRFFRHQDQRNWIMSYIYIIYIIWDTGTRMEKSFDNRHFFFKSIELVKASFEILRNIVFTFWYQVSMFWLCYPQYTALCLQPCLSKHVVLESYQNLALQVLILVWAECVRCPWAAGSNIGGHYKRCFFSLSFFLSGFFANSPRRGCRRVQKLCMGA